MSYTIEKFNQLLRQEADKYNFSQWEVYYEQSSSTQLQILQGEVSQYEAANVQGISFRGAAHGQMGYAFTEALTDKAISFLPREAKENCSILEDENEETIYAGDDHYEESDSFAPDLQKLSFETLAEIGLRLEAKIQEQDPRIKGVDHCFVSLGSDSLTIQNSKNLNLHHQNNLLAIYADSRCEENDIIKTGGDYWFGRDLKDLDIDLLASSIANRALSKLDAKPIPSGTYPVLFSAEAATDLLGTFWGIFSGELIEKGLSLLGDKLNQPIAAPCVTLVDYAKTDLMINHIPFDSEGVATQNKVLIDNGILKQVLHNRKTAKKAGVLPGGNGFRSGYKGSINVGTTNFYIQPGSYSHQDLIASLPNQTGLYVTEVSGLHAGANIVSGDFSLSCEGFWIENGKKVHGVDQITISDNFYQILQKIQKLGNTLFPAMPSESGSISAPELFISDIAIAGE